MFLKVLQANLNHARRAQDLFIHSLAERGCGVGIAAEPYSVPTEHSSWFADECDSVAIHCTPTLGAPGSLVGRGKGFVGVSIGDVKVVGGIFHQTRASPISNSTSTGWGPLSGPLYPTR